MRIPKPKDAQESEDPEKMAETEVALPQTLVRIPTEHAPMLQQSSPGDGNNAGGE